MLSVIVLSVALHLLLCWMSLCWVSLCWMSLCWMSWRQKKHSRSLGLDALQSDKLPVWTTNIGIVWKWLPLTNALDYSSIVTIPNILLRRIHIFCWFPFHFMKKRFFVAGSVSDRLLAYLIIAHSAKMLNRSKYSTLPFHRINSKRNFFCWSFRFCCSCLCNFARKKSYALALNVLHRDRLLLHIQILNLAKKKLTADITLLWSKLWNLFWKVFKLLMLAQFCENKIFLFGFRYTLPR